MIQHLRIFRPAATDVIADIPVPPSDAPALEPTLPASDKKAAELVAGSAVTDAASVGAGADSHEQPRIAPPVGMSSGPTKLTGLPASLMQRLMLFTGCVVMGILCSGCSAFRPLKGVPVQALPWDMRGVSRANMETIDLSRLSQSQPPAHLVDSGDVLAVYIEGALGKIEDVPPVFMPQNAESQPSLGYPIPVREDGSISLPLIRPMVVRGMTIAQVEDVVRRTYTVDKQILEPGGERILVSLQKPRTFKVTVLRQEASNSLVTSQSGNGSIQLGQTKKGTGQIVTLQVGENDVLRALTLSGGLPGLDAQNAIYILRRPRAAYQPWMAGTTVSRKSASPTPVQLTSGLNPYGARYVTPIPSENGRGEAWGHSSPQQPVEEGHLVQLEGAGTPDGWEQGQVNPVQAQQAVPPGPHSPPFAENAPLPEHSPSLANGPYVPHELQDFMSNGARVLRIPIRLHPGEEANFGEQDIILHDGDILFIESRETEIFYTGGLLGGGQHMLPRDYDLEVLDAISIAQGGQQSGGGAGFGSRIGGISAVNQDISVSASDLVVIRRMPDGSRMNIKVNLNKALRDENENLLIQPGDRLILRYTPIEAVGAFIERNLLAGSLLGLAAQQTLNGGSSGK